MLCCVWVTASLSPQLPLWTPHPSDSLDILKALCAVPAAFSPFIWVWFLAEPSNTEAGGENNRGQEEKSKMLTFIMCPLSPKITTQLVLDFLSAAQPFLHPKSQAEPSHINWPRGALVGTGGVPRARPSPPVSHSTPSSPFGASTKSDLKQRAY